MTPRLLILQPSFYRSETDRHAVRVRRRRLVPLTLAYLAALVPLKLRWSTLWTLALCKDQAFMDLAQRSGLLHINIGMESINPATLIGMNKRHNRVEDYPAILTDLRRRGISYSLNFIFGWDGETLDVFRSTLQFLCEQQVPAAYFNILTPEIGTAFYEQMLRDGRILRAAEVSRWPGKRCYIQDTRGEILKRAVRAAQATGADALLVCNDPALAAAGITACGVADTTCRPRSGRSRTIARR